MKVINEMVLTSEKKRMLAEIDEEVAQFDRNLQACVREKNILQSDMMIAQMKQVQLSLYSHGADHFLPGAADHDRHGGQ